MTTFSLDTLNGASEADFTAALGDIFEHSPWVAQQTAQRRPFATLKDLHDAMMAALRAAPAETRLALVKAHPDLAGKAARSGAMTADSISEQGSVGLDRLTDAEYDRFTRLNDAYQAKFGIPFIVCVRRHTKDSILNEFERRLTQDSADALNVAIDEIGRITALRLDARVTAPEKLKVTGRLSTHVLDTHGGRPAEGITVELWELSRDGADRLIVRAVTNSDGRTDAPLIGGRPLPIGTYELRFATAAYYAARGVAQSQPPFLDVVPIRFSIAEPEGHYHVPLVMTPWSYSTYRGS
jgi:2-oxo-4-hydroxy-4-carboxy-5-ureidoimidazoline decarboxylase